MYFFNVPAGETRINVEMNGQRTYSQANLQCVCVCVCGDIYSTPQLSSLSNTFHVSLRLEFFINIAKHKQVNINIKEHEYKQVYRVVIKCARSLIIYYFAHMTSHSCLLFLYIIIINTSNTRHLKIRLSKFL